VPAERRWAEVDITATEVAESREILARVREALPSILSDSRLGRAQTPFVALEMLLGGES